MESVVLIIAVILLILILVMLFWLMSTVLASRRETAGQGSSIQMLQSQLESLKAAQDKTSENLHKSLQSGQSSLHQSLQSSQKVLSQLNNQIGQLHKSSDQMIRLGSEVQRLRNILTSPKLRGKMGEWSLENLLSQILPQDSYRLQYSFKDGKKVDALVNLSDYSVPIDAKFPLPSFEAMAKAESEEAKKRLRKQFVRDVTAHIDKISDQYIRPAEGTLDFSMMYVPAENIYYETVVKYDNQSKDLLGYAMDKKVIPVSPNLLYAYLMTVVMGLHGMQIERQAAEIRKNLQKLNSDFSRFVSDWDTLGNHIRNTGKKYDQAGKHLDRFSMHLEQIQSGPEEESKQFNTKSED